MSTLSKKLPGFLGIVDALAGAQLLAKSSIPHRNRLAVILLDSAFETSCRLYLQFQKKIKIDEKLQHRENLVKAVKANLKSEVDDDVWALLDFYYQNVRNDLYHHSATKTITDDSLAEYRDAVEFVIVRANGVDETELRAAISAASVQAPIAADGEISDRKFAETLQEAKSSVDRVVLSVFRLNPKSVDEINGLLKRNGVSARFKRADFGNIVARNSGSKKYFYFEKSDSSWRLSHLGEARARELLSTEA